MRTLILALAAVATQAIRLKQLEGTFTCGPDGDELCGGTTGGTMAPIAGGEGESWGPMGPPMTGGEGSGPMTGTDSTMGPLPADDGEGTTGLPMTGGEGSGPMGPLAGGDTASMTGGPMGGPATTDGTDSTTTTSGSTAALAQMLPHNGPAPTPFNTSNMPSSGRQSNPYTAMPHAPTPGRP